MTKLNITVAFPSPEFISHKFNQDLLNLVFSNWLDFNLFVSNSVGSRIVHNRNDIVRHAKKNKSDYILWIDADTLFPASGLKRLLMHDKEVVCATTSRRTGEDRSPAAYPEDLNTIQPFQKLVKMKIVGPCFMLTKMSVFDKIERPYFAEPPRRLVNVYDARDYTLSAEEFIYDVVPEDEYFCWQLRKSGVDIWCDMELSMEIGHRGMADYYIKNLAPPGQPKPENIVFEEVSRPITEGMSEEQVHRALGGIGE